jgi:hypothetical protein
MLHHRRCLEESDVEGRVAHSSFLRLIATGPWLAIQARLAAWSEGRRTRGWQAVETVANVATLAALVLATIVTRHPAPLAYWGSVVAVTVTAPIWGAKIPHMVPHRHPLVRWLATLTGRLTPAIASVLLHELHHRRPALPVSLLAAHRHELEDAEEPACAGESGDPP